MWSRNGRELFFETLDNHIMFAAYAVKDDSFAADKPRMWSETPIAGVVNTAKSIDLAPRPHFFSRQYNHATLGPWVTVSCSAPAKPRHQSGECEMGQLYLAHRRSR